MRCKADASLRRTVIGSFQFPLGVYPVEDMTPRAGYACNFEAADGGNDGDEWEEWPDRYAYDIVVSAERLPAFTRSLFSLFEGRVYPILDVLGQDGYREIDPYIAYELVGLDRFYDGVRLFKDYLYEDGMCGFGLLAEEPFLYVFVDEHKIVTVRAEPTMKERVDRVLQAFELEQTDAAAGADASAHEHRGVLHSPGDKPEQMSAEEVVEFLKRQWQLVLNVDPEGNVDDEGKELGTTHWRAMVRCDFPDATVKYAEIVFDADNLREAEDIAFSACDELGDGLDMAWEDASVAVLDRLRPEQFAQVLVNTGFQAGTEKKAATKSKGKTGTGATKRAPKRATKSATHPDQSPAAGRVYVARWLA